MDRSRALLLVLLLVLAVAGLLYLLGPGSTSALGQDGGVTGEQAATAVVVEGAAKDPERELVPASAAETDGAAAAAGEVRPEPVRVWGRVLRRSDRSPVAGAEVRLVRAEGDQFWNLDLTYGREPQLIARTHSGPDGGFGFDAEVGDQYRLEVRAAGYPLAQLQKQVGGAAIEVLLDASAALQGVVVDKDSGAPLVDARVRLAVRGQKLELGVVRTDAAGRFSFESLPPCDVFAQVFADGYPEEWASHEIVAGKRSELRIEVAAGREIRGRVVDKQTGKGIAGAELAPSWTFKSRVRSDGDGRFHLRGMSKAHPCFYYVRCAGFSTTNGVIPEDLDGELVIQLERGATVHGRVLGPDGQVPPGLYVAAGASFRETQGYEHTDLLRAKIGAGGSFEISGLRPTQTYWLYLRALGCGTRAYNLARRVPAGERHDVGELRLRPEAFLIGKVVDEQGKGWAGISVSLRGMNADARDWQPDPRPRSQGVSQFMFRSIRTDPAGLFRFRAVAGGSYGLIVRKAGSQRSSSLSVEVADGGLNRDLRILLRRGAALEGVLVAPPGVKLTEHPLLVADAEAQSMASTARVGADGRFRFEGLLEASYTLRIMRGAPAGWTLPMGRSVRPGQTGLRLELVRSLAVSGQVLDASGKPRRASVYVQHKGQRGGSALHRTDAEGRFRVEVPPGFKGSVGAMLPDSPGSPSVREDGVVAGRSNIVLRFER